MNRVHDRHTQNELCRWIQLNGAFISTFDRFKMNWKLPNHLAIRIFGRRFWFECDTCTVHTHARALHRHKIIIDSKESVHRTYDLMRNHNLIVILFVDKTTKNTRLPRVQAVCWPNQPPPLSQTLTENSQHKKWYVKNFFNNTPLTRYTNFVFIILSNKNTV